jgi:hypothetical protein
MSTRERTERVASGSYVDRITLSKAVVAGVVGGIAFGIPLQFVIGRMGAIGALYTLGEPSVAVGWAAHLVHSAIFGLVFGLVTEGEPLHSLMEDNVGMAGFVGIGFGLALYVLNIGFVWPVWLDAVGFAPAAEWSIPFYPLRPMVGHVVYGAILGFAFALLVDY